VSTPPIGSKLERLERALMWWGLRERTYPSRAWAVVAVLAGVVNLVVSVPFLQYAGWDLYAFAAMNNLALGLLFVCQGMGDLLRLRSRTVARLLRVVSVLVLGPVILVCTVTLLIVLFGPARTFLGVAGVSALTLLIYAAIRMLLPPRLQSRFFGDDEAQR
jgi:hypothetical protein